MKTMSIVFPSEMSYHTEPSDHDPIVVSQKLMIKRSPINQLGAEDRLKLLTQPFTLFYLCYM